MGYRLITAPAADPVTLAEAKAHLRVDHSDEDATINGLIKAATSYLDGRSGILGRCLVTQTWEETFDAFPTNAIELPLGPVASVTSVKYLDQAGAEQTLSAGVYTVDTASLVARIVSDDAWPATKATANAVTVRYVAGTASASIPGAIRHAILLLVGHWYENRQPAAEGSAAELPFAVSALLSPFRRSVI